jgi:hypothetical protein
MTGEINVESSTEERQGRMLEMQTIGVFSIFSAVFSQTSGNFDANYRDESRQYKKCCLRPRMLTIRPRTVLFMQ